MDKSTILVILGLLFLLFCVCGKRSESFVEVFGLAGYKKPIDKLTLDYTKGGLSLDGFLDVTESGLGPDDISVAVKAITEYVNNTLDICAQVIETNKIQKFTRESSVLYRGRFMFLVTGSGFPFSLGVQCDILDGKVVSAQTQSSYSGNVVPYGSLSPNNYKPFSVVEEFGLTKIKQ